MKSNKNTKEIKNNPMTLIYFRLKAGFNSFTFPQQVFLIFVIVPIAIGLVIANIAIKIDYKENPFPDMPSITATWNTWRARDSIWTYITGITIWFIIIWIYLGNFKKTPTNESSDVRDI